MAAVIDIATADRLSGVQGWRPQLRLVHGGSGSVRSVAPRVYVIRRIVVLATAVVVVTMLAQVVAAAGRTVAAAMDVAPDASGRVHVVAQGETAWELAERYAPSMDRRAAVDELLALNGHGVLRVGQALSLPASFG